MPQVVLNKLFKHTQLQVGFGVIMLALVDGVPRVLSLKEMLHYYIAHQEEVIVRRTRYELAKAEERAHILEGYIIALDNIDEVIHIIRSSETDAEAAKRLTERFGLSKRQTDAILEMKLRRLTGLERTKIEEELDALREKIAYYKRVLSDDALVREIIKEELQEIKKKYGTSRKTRLSGDAKDIDVEDLIADENMVVTVTKAGYVKRLPVATLPPAEARRQRHAGRESEGQRLRGASVRGLHPCLHAVLLHCGQGIPPEGVRAARGVPSRARHGHREPASSGEGRDHFRRHRDEGIPVRRIPHVRHVARHGEEDVHGTVRPHPSRRAHCHQPEGRRRSSFPCAAWRPARRSSWCRAPARPSCGTRTRLRGMGRDTMGVRGMNVPPIARVLGMEIAKPDTELFVITEKGYGKRTPISEYPEHHRGGRACSPSP